MHFKSAQPARDGTLLPSLSVRLDDSWHPLEHDLKLISTFPQEVEFTVVGFTDTEECLDEECVELSLRRSRLAHDRLINRGMSVSRLKTPYGYGSARPIGDSATESGRAKNRRAYISDQGT